MNSAEQNQHRNAAVEAEQVAVAGRPAAHMTSSVTTVPIAPTDDDVAIDAAARQVAAQHAADGDADADRRGQHAGPAVVQAELRFAERIDRLQHDAADHPEDRRRR